MCVHCTCIFLGKGITLPGIDTVVLPYIHVHVDMSTVFPRFIAALEILPHFQASHCHPQNIAAW